MAEDFVGLLKELGVYDKNRVYDVKTAALELKRAKKKIASQAGEIKNFADKSQDDDLSNLYPDEGSRKLAQDNQDMSAKMGQMQAQMFRMTHPDYERVKDKMDDLLESDPALDGITDPELRLNTAYRLAGGRPDGQAGETQSKPQPYTETAGAGNPSLGGGHSTVTFEKAIEKFREDFKKELKPLHDRHERLACADKWEKKEMAIREEYGVPVE